MQVNQTPYGKATLKWQVAKEGGFVGAVMLGGKRVAMIEDSEEERLLARLRNKAGELHPEYVGFDGAMTRYRRFFPSRMHGTASASSERDYKERAAARLRATMPIDKAIARYAWQRHRRRTATRQVIASKY